ncbi:CheY-like chemotaxis protein [Microvirga lupini]|uniref:CheY-like chemotaxis protein n=1 Tax=Microvirga lupini TaxID=420324 RepID=A0A7W4VHN0_9HYPH|nr:response regulator [Microvirga lupini]MBB3017381.1 CheY-like chemotaxis protein [Microvirga lupini]
MIKILYVEDNEDNVYMLTQRLTRHGFQVSVASDGVQGIETARKEKPDLILMDLGLPALDGWTAARHLKQSPDTRDIPILALSAHTMPGDREKALAAGCDDYDAKPITFERLLEKIDSLIRGRSLP